MYEIELKELPVQPVLSIRTRTAMENLPNIIGSNYMKIMGYMDVLKEKPADVPYTAYFNMDMQDLDVEMGFPVSRKLEDKDEIKAHEIPAGKFAVCMYKGPYSGMMEPYNEIFKWIGEKGFEPSGIYYEYYYNSPAEVPESELLTRIAIPLK